MLPPSWLEYKVSLVSEQFTVSSITTTFLFTPSRLTAMRLTLIALACFAATALAGAKQGQQCNCPGGSSKCGCGLPNYCFCEPKSTGDPLAGCHKTTTCGCNPGLTGVCLHVCTVPFCSTVAITNSPLGKSRPASATTRFRMRIVG